VPERASRALYPGRPRQYSAAVLTAISPAFTRRIYIRYLTPIFGLVSTANSPYFLFHQQGYPLLSGHGDALHPELTLVNSP
jgi:hypothetical protein